MLRNRHSSRTTLTLLEAFVARLRAWQYGYELSQATGLKSGTLYPILMRLSDRGYLESRWQPAVERGRPPRHMYRLTADGAVFARAELARADAEGRLSTSGSFA